MTVNPKSFCQLELRSRDPVQSLAFLEAALGWTAIPVGFPDYTVLNVPEDCPYGISVLKDPETAAGTVPYFQIMDRLDEVLARCHALGAQMISGPRLIPGYGQAAVIEEKGGIRLGFFVAEVKAKAKAERKPDA